MGKNVMKPANAKAAGINEFLLYKLIFISIVNYH
jgi:hypothetical protein